ncbi:alpha/beta hydrolase [Christensenellaceae bacterium OttesenSCG-928-L17]|nr:alpha/beta hydrolase [Christensenellaceae bacterium OttesenSCG-928-L17]
MNRKEMSTKYGTVCYWVSSEWNSSDKTLVFLHGLTANHTMFDNQLTYFSEKYNLLTWDAPAHGESRPYSGFSYQNTAEALKQILDENHIDTAVLIGQSMGGYIAQSFIQRYPERVFAFIAIDTSPYGEIYYSKSDKWWLRQIEWMSKLFPHDTLKKSIAKQVSVTEVGYQNMMSMLVSYDKKELCYLMGIGYAAFLEDNKDMQITCPVLILLGDCDKTGKVQQYCRAWSEKERYKLIIINGAAHNSNVDNPDEVNAAIEHFLHTM